MRTKGEMLSELDVMLMEAFVARTKGASHPHTSRALGSADGYMKALLDAGIVTQKELLARVAGARVAAEGPAVVERPAQDEAAA